MAGFDDILGEGGSFYNASNQLDQDLEQHAQDREEDEVVKKYGIPGLKAYRAGLDPSVLTHAVFDETTIAVRNPDTGKMGKVGYNDLPEYYKAGYTLVRNTSPDYIQQLEEHEKSAAQQKRQEEYQRNANDPLSGALAYTNAVTNAATFGLANQVARGIVGGPHVPSPLEQSLESQKLAHTPGSLNSALQEFSDVPIPTSTMADTASGAPQLPTDTETPRSQAIKEMVTRDAERLHQQAIGGQAEHEYLQTVSDARQANPLLTAAGGVLGTLAPGPLSAVTGGAKLAQEGIAGKKVLDATGNVVTQGGIQGLGKYAPIIGGATKYGIEGLGFGADIAAEKASLEADPKTPVAFIRDTIGESLVPFLLGAGLGGLGGLAKGMAKAGKLGPAIMDYATRAERASAVPPWEKEMGAAAKKLLREKEAEYLGRQIPAGPSAEDLGAVTSNLEDARNAPSIPNEAAKTAKSQFQQEADTALKQVRSLADDMIPEKDMGMPAPKGWKSQWDAARKAFDANPTVDGGEALVELAQKHPRFSHLTTTQMRSALLDAKEAAANEASIPVPGQGGNVNRGYIQQAEQDFEQVSKAREPVAKAEYERQRNLDDILSLREKTGNKYAPPTSPDLDVEKMTRQELLRAQTAERNALVQQQAKTRRDMRPELRDFREQVREAAKSIPKDLVVAGEEGKGVGREWKSAERAFEKIGRSMDRKPDEAITALNGLEDEANVVAKHLPEASKQFQEIAQKATEWRDRIEKTMGEVSSDRLAKIQDLVDRTASNRGDARTGWLASVFASREAGKALGLAGGPLYAFGALGASMIMKLSKANSAMSRNTMTGIAAITRASVPGIKAAGLGAQRMLSPAKHLDKDALTEQARQLQALSPEILAQNIDRGLQGLEHASPAIYQAVKEKLMAVGQYLAQNAPKQNPQTAQTPFDSHKDVLNDQEAYTWNQQLELASDPSRIIPMIQSGKLTPEAWKVVNTLSPEYAQYLVSQLGPLLAQQKKLPYAVRKAVSAITGKAQDSTLEPGFIRFMGNIIHAPQPDKPANKGGNTLKMKPEETQSQRITDK